MFANKHVIITGGSSGLGLELARGLIDRGARVTLMARDEAKLRRAAEELRGRRRGAWVGWFSVDVRQEVDTKAAMDEAVRAGGGIDVLINSAGILREGHFEDLPLQDFRDVMDVNYVGVINATRGALPHLRASRGRLVTIASMAGLTGVYGYTPYSSAKHALVGLTESLRYELKPMGVGVSLVCPGEFDSPMVDALDRTRTPENRAHVLTIPKATVESIAADTLKGIETGRFLIIPGRMTRAAAHVSRLLPSLSRAIGDRAVARARARAKPTGFTVDASLADLRAVFRAAPQPRLDDLAGAHRAQFAGPAWLRAAGPRATTLAGMPKWYGKRFDAAGEHTTTLSGENLVRSPDGVTGSIPLTAEVAPSRIDGRPALVVRYPIDAAWPWRLVSDELRPVGDGVLLGMTLGIPMAPPGGFPFVLHRAVSR